MNDPDNYRYQNCSDKTSNMTDQEERYPLLALPCATAPNPTHNILDILSTTDPTFATAFAEGGLKKMVRSCLSIKNKVAILKVVEENRMKKSEIAEKFGLAKSTLASLIKNKDKIFAASRTMRNPDRKRVRLAAYPELEEIVCQWIDNVQLRGELVSPQVLKMKIREFARSMGIIKFRTSEGWLNNFKKRNGLRFCKVSGKFSCVRRQVYDVISRNENTPRVSNDSDGAGSERSSDSESGAHPVQLFQCEQPKQQKRTFTNYSSDIIFCKNGTSEMDSEQMIVPYVQEKPSECTEPSDDDEIQELQVKVEPVDVVGLQDGNSPSEYPKQNQVSNSTDNTPNPIVVQDPLPSPPSPKELPTQPARTPKFSEVAVVQALVQSVLNDPTKKSAKEKEGSHGILSDTLTQSAVAPDSLVPQSSANTAQQLDVTSSPLPADQTCFVMMRLADCLERQTRVQEEMLAIKKEKMSEEAVRHREEIALLKQKLEVEERKVLALEQLLAVHMKNSTSQ